MAITLDDIRNEKERIIYKHPNLNGYTIKSLNDYPICDNKLSSFIELNWQDDYSDEIRIIFSPDFLSYNNPLLDKDCSILLFERERLEGCFLCYRYEYTGKKDIITAHNTALTIKQGNRGKGKGQLLWVEQMKRAFEKGYTATTYWIDIRHNQKGQSYSIFGNNKVTAQNKKKIPMLAKSLSFEKASSYGKLSRFEKIGLKVIDKIFSRKPKHFSIEIDSAEGQVFSFLNSLKKRYVPCPNQDTLRNKSNYRSETLNSSLFAFKQGGKVIGFFYGFTVPVNNKDNYFQIDGFFFKKDLGWKTKHEMILLAEQVIKDHYDPFLCIIPANCSNENLIKYGFIPAENQLLVVNLFEDIDYKGLPIELR